MAKRTVPLPSTEYLNECFHYDPETGIVTWKERPLHHFKNKKEQGKSNLKAGATIGTNSRRYPKVKVSRATFTLHRVIFKMMTGEWPDWIDHLNGIKTDNRWVNLRSATPQQNGWNRRPSGKALPRGVGLNKNGTRYVARIRIGGVKTHLGVFDTPEEAYAKWCSYAHERGEFFRAD